MTCPNLVDTGEWSNYAKDTVKARCGSTRRGETQLCAKHLAEAKKNYPQGWDYYPGDRCKHGVYVGGCAEDFMCGACENGED